METGKEGVGKGKRSEGRLRPEMGQGKGLDLEGAEGALQGKPPPNFRERVRHRYSWT